MLKNHPDFFQLAKWPCHKRLDDCNDLNANMHPGAEEIPNHGIDEDCDGEDLTTSIHAFADTVIRIYPNPARDVIHVEVNGQGLYDFSLFDLTGKLMQSVIDEHQIDVTPMQDGMYLLKISDITSGFVIVEKVVVEK